MSTLSTIEGTIAGFFTSGSATSASAAAAGIDIAKIGQIVIAIAQAAPAIEQGVASIEPYVAAIISMIKNGGNPSQADWDALTARLNAGSSQLDAAAVDAKSNPESDAYVTQPAAGA